MTYRPLCGTPQGRRATEKKSFKPFIDSSCRREPDLEQPMPTISALCRGRNFAPRLRIGDRVVYLTAATRGVWRLVAMLEVAERFEQHREAAVWFAQKGLPLPNNCLVRGNPPHPMSETGEQPGGCATLKDWDAAYQARARLYGTFLVCKPHYLDLVNPPIITREDWLEWHGRVPATRNPANTPHLWEHLWRATSRNSPA